METQIALLLDLHRMESAAYGNCAGEDLQKTEERLDPPLLKYYRKIKQRRGFGVAIQKDRTCSGCRMVYPEAHSIVQCSDLIHKCEYCGRLLVASDEIVLPRPHSEAPVAATYQIEPAEDNIDPAQDSEESWEEPETVILHADDDQAY